MKCSFVKCALAAMTAVLIFLAGCDLISGTFVVSLKLVENEDLQWLGQMYYAEVDLTGEQVWADHGDDIHNIDLLGFELWGRNLAASGNEFNAYMAPMGSSLADTSTVADVEDSAIVILNALPFPAESDVHVTYGESFTYLTNFDDVKALLESGQFKFFGIPDQPIDIHIDSLIVIVTFTAGN